MQFVALVFEARTLNLRQNPDSETLEIQFFDLEDLPEHLHANNLEIIFDALSSLVRPYIR